MRALPLILLFLSASCATPDPAPCQRVIVDAQGTPLSALPPAIRQPVLLAGAAAELSFVAPTTSCVSDELRLTATLRGPDDVQLPVEVLEAPTVIGTLGAVRATIRFTPTQPGVHLLKLVFEPSLGVREPLLVVAEDGLDHVFTRVALPSADCQPIFPLSDDGLACGDGTIHVAFSDGSTSTFEGRALVVTGSVLWSIHPVTQALERRVLEGHALRLTHTADGFVADALPALQEENLALRSRANGGIAVARLDDSGILRVLDRPRPPPGVLIIDENDRLRVWTDWYGPSPCDLSCDSAFGLRGVDSELLWSSDPQAPESPLTATLRARFGTPAFTLSQQAESLLPPAGAFERLPLWLAADAGLGRQVLVESSDAGLRFTGWPRREVLQVGRSHVVVADPGAPTTLRVYEK